MRRHNTVRPYSLAFVVSKVKIEPFHLASRDPLFAGRIVDQQEDDPTIGIGTSPFPGFGAVVVTIQFAGKRRCPFTFVHFDKGSKKAY
ncbi:hypothetical protein [Paenibacillus sophorae]|uniref:hypothetical protein n=1 Tax=Paenibacillus sophorae TaxID=1333845 RepID=UPI001FE6A575|nr:hypothetical protein [Paenibacillus sophorae]